MIQIRLIGTLDEIEDAIAALEVKHEVHCQQPRPARYGGGYICNINALIPKKVEIWCCPKCDNYNPNDWYSCIKCSTIRQKC